MSRGWSRPLRVLWAAVLLAGLVVALGGRASTADELPAALDVPHVPGLAGDVLTLPPLTTREGRIVDADGRDVLLRGANVNSWGEYWQGVPGVDPTIPVTEADWERMAARGFSVVRLLVTWSRIEPARDVIDTAYLDEIDAAVQAARARGIYTVIDMHQDAYSAFISTPDPRACPAGTMPAKGWDGAPAWAVLTDGLSTCRITHERNSSPAVQQAWESFYDDRDGIRSEFVEMWGVVAARFAGRPEVAGFDILNEPEVTRPARLMRPVYDDLVGDVVREIRAAQTGAPFRHLVFVEPAMATGVPSNGMVFADLAAAGVGSDGVVLAHHNYAESIGSGITIAQANGFFEFKARQQGLASWGGEYGFWDVEPATLDKAVRYAADEDRRRWGGAWWQWRQSCGDPHSVWWSGDRVVAPSEPVVHLNVVGCPGNVDLGPNDEFLSILGRGYPRATPGRLDHLASDPASGRLRVEGSGAEAGATLVVWTPTVDGPLHRIGGSGLRDVRAVVVPGGRIIEASVVPDGPYVLWVGPAQDPPPSSTTTSAADTTSASTEAVGTTSEAAITSAPSGPGPVAGGLVAPSGAGGAAPAVRAVPRYAG